MIIEESHHPSSFRVRIAKVIPIDLSAAYTLEIEIAQFESHAVTSRNMYASKLRFRLDSRFTLTVCRLIRI